MVSNTLWIFDPLGVFLDVVEQVDGMTKRVHQLMNPMALQLDIKIDNTAKVLYDWKIWK